jgi:hypothetical protein
VHIKSLVILHNGMAGVVSTLSPATQLHAFAQNIHNLALAFVTPLRTKNDCRHRIGRLRKVVSAYVEFESPFY